MAKGLRFSILPATAAFAVLFLALPRTGADATIRITGPDGRWTYEPAELQIDPGARVAFANDSDTTHTATCSNCPWTTGDVQPGQTKLVTFGEVGQTSFACRYHPDVLTGVLTAGQPPTASPSPSPTS